MAVPSGHGGRGDAGLSRRPDAGLSAIRGGLSPSSDAGLSRHFDAGLSEAGLSCHPEEQSDEGSRAFQRHGGLYNDPMAFDASTATHKSEMRAWIIVRSFAHRDSTGVSVGENAVLVQKDRNR